MTIRSKYNIGDKVYISYNRLNEFDNDTAFLPRLTLHQDFPLLGVITKVSISGEYSVDFGGDWRCIAEKSVIRYKIKILSPAYNSIHIPEGCFPEVDCFDEEDVFSSIEEMQDYMISHGTYFLQRGLTLNEVKQIIEDNEI